MKHMVSYLMDIGLLTGHSVVKENTENLSIAQYPNLSPHKRLYATVTNLITETRPVSWPDQRFIYEEHIEVENSSPF